MDNKSFRVITLGCKLNFCESAAIEKSMSEGGFSPAPENQPADIYIINTCAVTGMAVSKARHALSASKRENPGCITVLCGCFPQSYPKEAGLDCGADIVTGNSDKSRICGMVKDFLNNHTKQVNIKPLSRDYDETSAVPDEDRTRAFIKIEDGCNRFCSYCIIPTARGRVRSLAPDKITEQAIHCAENGHKEIVLTGINLGCYGEELGLTLADAVKAAEKSGVPRIRLSSLEPEMMTDEVIAGLKSVKSLCPHFHLSLQSGSDNVLRAMNRRYDTAQYKSVADKLRMAFPGCSLTTDIIVGFPGETDEDFAKSMDFAEKIGFAKIHVFPYSIRKGTVAAEMEQVMPQVKTERARAMNAAAKELEYRFFQSVLGTEHTVLVEKKQSEQYSNGFTESYIPVRIYGEEIPRHSLVKVKITGAREGFCVGKPI